MPRRLSCPRPRILRWAAVLKCIGAALCAAIFTLWVASGWFALLLSFRRGSSTTLVGVEGGLIGFIHAAGPADPYEIFEGLVVNSYRIGPRFEGWRWLPYHQVAALPGGFSSAETYVPLFVPFSLIAIPTCWIFYRDRRSARWVRAGRCAGCGYDMAGLAAEGAGGSAVCPECGKQAPA